MFPKQYLAELHSVQHKLQEAEQKKDSSLQQQDILMKHTHIDLTIELGSFKFGFSKKRSRQMQQHSINANSSEKKLSETDSQQNNNIQQQSSNFSAPPQAHRSIHFEA